MSTLCIRYGTDKVIDETSIANVPNGKINARWIEKGFWMVLILGTLYKIDVTSSKITKWQPWKAN
jgi:hypothetical protein